MRKSLATVLTLVIFAVCFLHSSAEAVAKGRKFALLIGNNVYSNLNNQTLETAINDADAIAARLQALEFEKENVFVAHNVSRSEFIRLLRDFSSRLTKDDFAVFFFAGHGVNFGGRNFYLPSDIPQARGNTPQDEEFIAENAVSEAFVVRTISNAARTTFAIFDACRNNPLNVGNDPTRAFAPGTGGLARPIETEGVGVLYSAADRKVAYDRLPGEEKAANSLFTRVLLEQLSQPGQTLKGLAESVRSEVSQLARANGVEQRPTWYNDIDGDVQFSKPQPVAAAESPAAAAWRLVQSTTDKAVLRAFIETYQNDSLHRGLAVEALARLDAATPVPVTVEPPAKSTDPEPTVQAGSDPAPVVEQPPADATPPVADKEPVQPTDLALLTPPDHTEPDHTEKVPSGSRPQQWFAVLDTQSSHLSAERRAEQLRLANNLLGQTGLEVAKSSREGFWDVRVRAEDQADAKRLCRSVLSAPACRPELNILASEFRQIADRAQALKAGSGLGDVFLGLFGKWALQTSRSSGSFACSLELSPDAKLPESFHHQALFLDVIATDHDPVSIRFRAPEAAAGDNKTIPVAIGGATYEFTVNRAIATLDQAQVERFWRAIASSRQMTAKINAFDGTALEYRFDTSEGPRAIGALLACLGRTDQITIEMSRP